jgi:hypothetical protein
MFNEVQDKVVASSCLTYVTNDFASWTKAHPTPTAFDMDDGADHPFPDMARYPAESYAVWPKDCCGTCTVGFGDAHLTYWPPGIDLGGATTLVMDNQTL